MAVQDVMHTFNPMHDYEYSWTIDNFSHSPDVIQGPPFSPIPGFPENLCLKLQYAYSVNEKFTSTYCHSLKVSLVDLDAKDRLLVVSSYIKICNTNDKIFKDEQNLDTEFKQSMDLLEYTSLYEYKNLRKMRLAHYMNLLDDKLIVKGKLSISGYDIVSSVSAKDGYEVCRELLKDLKTMYESGSSTDIKFSVGEQTLGAHKNILISRSPVFAKMFNHDMLESNTQKVVIEDADFHSFNCFLMFLYTGIVEDEKWDTVHSLYCLAHKYQVNSLHLMCSRLLGSMLTIDSACSVLILSDLHGDQDLKYVAKVFIRHHLIQIVGTSDWIELASTKPKLVKQILAQMASGTSMKKA